MKKLRVFYRDEMNVTDNVAVCRNAEKPGLYVADCADLIEVVGDWAPLTVEELSVGHDERHVRRVLSGDQNNGFGNNLPSVAASLPWESASFYRAAVDSLDQGVSMSPTVGFHHADFKECWNFCSFNGLTIAALLMHQRGQADRVGIIDFDCHWGNGTDAVIEFLGLDFISHYTFGKFKRLVRKGIGFDRWLEDLPGILEEKFQGCGVLFYQAGVDAHLDDHFGGELTTAQMILRDRIVFSFARREGIPLVWNLAGGYQEPYSKVLALHRTTTEICLDVYR